MSSVRAPGASASWKTGKSRALKLFDEFAAAARAAAARAAVAPGSAAAPGATRAPASFASLVEADVVSFDLWERFAGFLTLDYASQGAGEYLKSSVATNYLSTVINAAHDMFRTAGAATQLFFTCLSSSSHTHASNWLRKLKLNMQRISFERDKTAGTPMMDDAAEGIYLEDVKRLVNCYARNGSPEAVARKMVILAAHLSAGRSGECRWVTLDSLHWDVHFQCLVAEIPQSKVAKVKLAAFGAGIERDCCFLTCLGDYLAAVGFKSNDLDVDDDSNETFWLFPCLCGTESAGSKLGVFVKQVLKGGSKKYEKVADKGLSTGLNGAGFRVGAVNALFATMPIELATATTGHSLVSISAFFEYFRPTIAGLMNGLVVLSGFPAPSWGHSSKGTVPAKLLALIATGVDAGKLEAMQDALFRFDSASPAAFRAEGALRPATVAAFASIIMYYAARERKGEMGWLLARMRECWIHAFRPGEFAAADAHQTLKEWSLLVRAKFERDNLHLLQHEDAELAVRVVASVQQLGTNFERLGLEMSDAKESTAQMREALNDVKRQLSTLVALFRGQAGGVAPGAPVPAPAAAETATEAPASAQARATEGAYEADGATTLTLREAAPMPAPAQRAIAAPPSFLVSHRGVDPYEKITAIKALDFYIDYMRRGGALPRLTTSDKSIARHIPEWYNAFATVEERALLKGPDNALEKRVVAKVLNELVFQRLALAYTEKAVLLPKSLKGAKAAAAMLVGFINSRVRDMKKKHVPLVVPDRAKFMAFRHERLPSSLAAAPAATPTVQRTSGAPHARRAPCPPRSAPRPVQPPRGPRPSYPRPPPRSPPPDR